MSTVRRINIAAVEATAEAGETTGQGPVTITTGWIYIVRPPAWPMVRTPSTRGGVPSASTVPSIHIIAVVQPGVERIFFLGGRDASGASVPCTLRVESLDTPLQQVDLDEGSYAERRADPLSSQPGQLTKLRYDTLPPTHPISIFLASIKPGQSGSGGINEGGAAGS